MRFLFLIMASAFLVSCSSSQEKALSTESQPCCSQKSQEHQSHEHEMHHNHNGHPHGKSDCCVKKDKSADCDCKSECKGNCAGGCDHHGSSCSAEKWSLMENPALRAQISKEDFTKTYEKNKDALGAKCSNPAMEYCGKSTKDKSVTEAELVCLWTKSHRVTRERLAQLDGTPCDKMIKGFAAKTMVKKNK